MFWLRHRRPVSLVNGRVLTSSGLCTSLRFASTVLALDERPAAGDAVVDLGGAFVLPGLVNAHDHLELNHYGPLKTRDRYADASQWIEDLRPVIATDVDIRRRRCVRLADRLLVGGVKNLLGGATTVAHHNPLYREIGRRFPVRVIRRVGWAHSFHLEGRPVGANGEPGPIVERAFRETPASVPFIVHVAEGVSADATDELDRLDRHGCLAANTVLVHGVGVSVDGWRRACERGASLVWCPGSNEYLFGRTIPARAFLDAHPRASERIALGTDSRLTGSRDLLDELRAARAASTIAPSELLRMVTTTPAQMLRRPEVGALYVGAPADLIVVPARGGDAAGSLLATRRAGLDLVVVGGLPAVGAPARANAFRARGVSVVPLVVDEEERIADGRLARDIARCTVQEPGVFVRSSPYRRSRSSALRAAS